MNHRSLTIVINLGIICVIYRYILERLWRHAENSHTNTSTWSGMRTNDTCVRSSCL